MFQARDPRLQVNELFSIKIDNANTKNFTTMNLKIRFPQFVVIL